MSPDTLLGLAVLALLLLPIVAHLAGERWQQTAPSGAVPAAAQGVGTTMISMPAPTHPLTVRPHTAGWGWLPFADTATPFFFFPDRGARLLFEVTL